jgi:hypothetical protein
MYKKDTNSAFLNAALVSTVGAGIVTSFAISQGQDPALAVLITAIAVGFTLICHRAGLV